MYSQAVIPMSGEPMAAVPMGAAPLGAQRHGAKTPHGTAPPIQSMDPNNIRIMYKAEIDYYCCAQCFYEGGNICNAPERKYFHVHENAYERNIPLSICCVQIDTVTKFFFDRGVYAQNSCLWQSGCLRGDPSLFSNYSRYVCCCMDCPDCCNQYISCHYPSLCGDRVMVLTSEVHCCCLPTRSCWFYNCCGLCGIKDNDPIPGFTFPLVASLVPGTGIELAGSMDHARALWKQRLATGNGAMGVGVPMPVAMEMAIPK